MLNRRSFLGGLSASLPLFAMPGALRAQAAPRLLAMIVGINKYTGKDGRGQPIRSLNGCINDATDIEQQVQQLKPVFFRRLGWDGRAEIPVTRARFLDTWRDLLAAGEAGDTALLTFSGHGSQIPVLPGNPSGEADGMDETLVLTGYNVADGRNGEHIIDDELGELFRAAHDKGIIVVFASDSCHSGTVYRAIERRDVSYRTLTPDLQTRAGPAAAVPQPAAPPPEAPPNLLFLAGAQENELVPELPLGRNGELRGALSVAVARALQGQAATDGVITASGLARFVLRNVRTLSDSGQHARITWPTPIQAASINPTKATPVGVRGGEVRGDTRLFVFGASAAPPPDPAAADRSVRLRILGRSAAEQQSIIRSLRNAELAGEQDGASLVWDATQGVILNDQRNRIAEGVTAAQLQHAIDRRRALDRLIGLTERSSLDVRILLGGLDTPASDATHKPGTKLSIKVTGVEDGEYFAVFNLAGNGVVQMLEPTPYRQPNPRQPNFSGPDFVNGKEKRRGASDIDLGDVDVQAPFGADHVVAVAGTLPLSRLMPALVEAHKKGLAVADAMAGLASELAIQQLKVGFRGIYTGRS